LLGALSEWLFPQMKEHGDSPPTLINIVPLVVPLKMMHISSSYVIYPDLLILNTRYSNKDRHICTSMPPHLINPQLDGVQHIIPDLFSTNPTTDKLTKTLLLLWYIWKARNDHRFQRKSWTSFQVHNAVATHFQTNLSAWEEHMHSDAKHNISTSPNHNPHVEDTYLVQFPSQLQGFRCYSDASISPDQLALGE
jgi:hypothetical protein